MFKTFYLDPMMYHTKLLFNCYEDEDNEIKETKYTVLFDYIKRCVSSGEDCAHVCSEFKIGSSSELFIGNLKDLYEFQN